MTPQRRLIKALDRPGCRALLGWLASAYARRKTGLDVEILYDDAWIRRAGTNYLAESPTFDWTAGQIAGWKQDLQEVLDMYRDWWFYCYRPKPGDVIVDIGAGIGEDAIVFSQSVGKQGRVLSVEAHPATFRLLQKTRRLNRLDNTTTIHRAVMDKPGRIYIESRAAHKGNTIAESGDHAVNASSLDELCVEQGVSRIDFLKMNIEGAERHAIAGMSRMIAHTEALCIACHDFLGEQNEFYRTKSLIVEFVRDHGFEVSLRDQHPDPWVRDHVYGVRRQ